MQVLCLLFCCLCALLCRCVGFLLDHLRLCSTRFIDLLSLCIDILRIFLNVCDFLHHSFLGAKCRRSTLCIHILGIFAG